MKAPAGTDEPTCAGDGAIDNSVVDSAHPAIGVTDPTLAPDEFSATYQVTDAQAACYEIIFHAAKADPAEEPIVIESVIDYRRREPDAPPMGLRFRGASRAAEGWLADAEDHEALIVDETANSVNVLRALATMANGTLHFDIEDVTEGRPALTLVELLHRMEAANVGRPATYASTLRKVIEKNDALAIDNATGAISLTETGVAIASRLESRCGQLGSVEFAGQFETYMNDVASGRVSPAEFLRWVMTASRPDDVEEAGEIWDSVDELVAGGDTGRARERRVGGVVTTAVGGAPASDDEEAG